MTYSLNLDPYLEACRAAEFADIVAINPFEENTYTRQSEQSRHSGEPMPSVIPVAPAALSPPSAEAINAVNANEALATLNVTRDKTSGKLLLSINAKPLHDMLDLFGALFDSNGMYKNRPLGQPAIAMRNKLSSEPFLARHYPHQIAISSIYDHPPTIKELMALCHSAEDAIRLIIAHYQPIDIRVRINKVLK